MTLAATISASVAATLADTAPTNPLGASSAASVRASSAPGARLTNGTGAGQADIMYSDSRTVTDGATEDLDLNGVLLDALGNQVDAARIKAIQIVADEGNTTDLTIGGDANAWATFLNAAGTLTFRPGSWMQAGVSESDATGWAVTAGTGDTLQVVNGAGADATYTIIVIGASA